MNIINIIIKIIYKYIKFIEMAIKENNSFRKFFDRIGEGVR
jgi:hypothetical protein